MTSREKRVLTPLLLFCAASSLMLTPAAPSSARARRQEQRVYGPPGPVRLTADAAVKDGRAVSQYVTLEYNFNVY